MVLAAVLCLTMLPAAIFGTADTAKTETAPDGSTWTIDGNNYTSKTRLSWPDYSYYPLGETSDQIVTLSADVNVSKKGYESMGEGGNIGFLFGVSDTDNDGKIEETGDYYYLVQVGSRDNEPLIGIERNNKVWGGWAQQVNYTYSAGEKVNFCVTFDPATTTFLVYANGKLVISYTDSDPLPGKGYGLASRVTNGTFKNVDRAVGKTPDWIKDNRTSISLTEDLYESIVDPAGKTLKLDLNGHRITETLVNYGNLTLTDSKGGGHIEVRKGYMSQVTDRASAIDNFGTLTVDGATIICVGTGGSTEAVGIYNRLGASLTVKSGLIQSITEKDKYGFGIQNLGTIEEISGGKITSEMVYRVNTNNNCAITNDGGTIKKITGGEIYARTNGNGSDMYGVAIRNRNGATIGEISGGYIHAEVFGSGVVLGFGIYNTGNSKIEKISGGTIEAYTTATKWVFGIKNDCYIGEISGGLIRSYIDHTDSNNSIAVANLGSGEIVSITGGVFSADGISGGKIGIRCQDSSKVTSLTGGAFYVAGDTQYLVGTNASSGYELKAGGSANYRFVTATGAQVTEEVTENGIVAKTNSKTYTLYANSEKASIGTTVYNTVADAIAAAANGDVVKLLGNSSTAVNVPADKNITIDLNGTTLRATLTNRGTLTLKDSAQTGRIITKSDVNGELYTVDNFGTLTVDGANIRVFGLGGGTQAFGIKNEKNANLTVLSGKIQSTTRSTNFGFAIKNYGTIIEIAGGEMGAEITLPIGASSGTNVIAIAQVEGAVIKKISGGTIWARSNNTGGDSSYSSAIRNQGGSVIEEITGGSMRAFALKNGDNGRVSFGIYNENGTIKKISGGFIAGYTSAEQWTFGIKNDVNGKIESISGGYIFSEMDNGKNGPNSIAVANWGIIGEISGGTFYALSYNGNGTTYAVRTTGAGHSANITGGAFYAGKNTSDTLLANDGGVITLPEGAYLACADSDGFRYIESASDIADDDIVVYALGSSVTRGEATKGSSFADLLDDADNGIKVIKSAISGTTLVSNNNDANSYVARLQKDFKGLPAPDYLIVQLSTNDATQNKALGSLSNGTDIAAFNTETIIGAIEYIIAYAKETWNCEVIFYTNPKYDSNAYAAMVNAMPAICEKWGIGLVDFYNYGCMQPLDNLNPLMNDNIHPNAVGYQWMAEIFEGYFNASVNDTLHEFEDGRCVKCGAKAVDYNEDPGDSGQTGDGGDTGDGDEEENTPTTGDISAIIALVSIATLAGATALTFSKKRHSVK